MKRWLGLIFLFALFLPAAPAAAQGDEFAYLSWDTVITLEEGDSYVVEVTQSIRFDGQYSVGFLEIPREFTSGIEIVGVGDGEIDYERGSNAESPGVYTVDTSSTAILVEWGFPPTSAGEIRTYTITFRVDGGLFVYPQERRLDWELLPADRSGLAVESASLTVNFPSQISPDTVPVDITGAEMDVTYRAQQLVLSTTSTVPNGQAVLPVIVFPPEVAPDAQPQPWQQRADAADLAFTVEKVAVNLALNGDGTVDVVEEQRVSVQSGALYSGFKALSLRQLDAITDVVVAEGDLAFRQEQESACLNCFRVTVDPRRDSWVTYRKESGELIFDPNAFGSIDLLWEFPPLVAGDETTFRLHFRTLGAIQRLEEEQRLTWTVIPQDNPPVESAEVRLTPPAGVTPEMVEVPGGSATVENGQLVLRRNGRIPAGTGWQVAFSLPPAATSGAAPLWQQELETTLEEARQIQQRIEQRLARLRLAFLAGTIGLLIGGPLAIVALWYWRGRDPDPVSLAPDVLSEPPSDLPPAIVNFLVEEEPTAQGVLAALFHLATLGLLQVNTSAERLRFERALESELHEGETVETPAGTAITLPFHLVYLFNLLREIIPTGESVSLRKISNELGPYLPQIYVLLGKEADVFFASRPSAVRRRWRNVGQWLVIGSTIVTLPLALGFFDDVGWLAAGPGVAGVAVGLVLMVVARFMPQRTHQGAEEAALWEAFGAYLRELRQRAGVGEAQRLVDRYFSYAVALGVADLLFEQLRELGGAPPVWTRPLTWEDVNDPPLTPIPRPRLGEVTLPTLPGSRRPSSAPLPRSVTRRARQTGEEGGFGGLDAMARELTSALDNAGGELTHLLNSAVDASDESPFELVVRGAGAAARFSWKAGTTTAKIAAEIISEMDTGGGGGYSGGSSSRSSWSSSSRSSSRSFSSRRSSGSGGRSGFR